MRFNKLQQKLASHLEQKVSLKLIQKNKGELSKSLSLYFWFEIESWNLGKSFAFWNLQFKNRISNHFFNFHWIHIGLFSCVFSSQHSIAQQADSTRKKNSGKKADYSNLPKTLEKLLFYQLCFPVAGDKFTTVNLGKCPIIYAGTESLILLYRIQ